MKDRKHSLRRNRKGLKISSRILLYTGILLIGSLLVTGILFQQVYSSIMFKRISFVSLQNVQSIGSSVETVLTSMNNYSKIVLSNDSAQDLLKTSDEYAPPELRRSFGRFLRTLITNFSEISSIYLFDFRGNRHFSSKMRRPVEEMIDSQPPDVLFRALPLSGKAEFRLNGGIPVDIGGSERFVSCMRVVNDLNTMSPIGMVMVNLDQDGLSRAFKGVFDQYGTDLYILDRQGRNILTRDNDSLTELIPKIAFDEPQAVQVIQDGREKMLAAYISLEMTDWTILSIHPYSGAMREEFPLLLTTLIIILVNGVLIFSGSLIITRMIARPVNQLLTSMDQNSDGVLTETVIHSNITEFISLQDGYNRMIRTIQVLMHNAVKDEKIRRKAELDVLQAQIKPHFLYNTFDAVSSLALMGRTDDVYKMMVALGQYYRISLSKGREIIPLSQELDAVKNYLFIQQIRYGDIFTVEYDVDETLGRNSVLKLILQPLVENALYHGIKPMGEPGTIRIFCRNHPRGIEVGVEDNGVGMSQDRINSVLFPDNNDGAKSFGLYGTIQRVRIFYGHDDLVAITSEPGRGSRVSLFLPCKDGVE